MTSTEDGYHQIDYLKDLIENIRSDDEQERVKTIALIPNLILQSINEKNGILNQLLLVIYNLNTDDDNFETLNLGNRTTVIRYLLRLYAETIKDHKREQIDALIKLTKHAYHSSELLIELANALYHCDLSTLRRKGSKEDISKTNEINRMIGDALQSIKERASENLYSDSLLMIYSIMELRQQQHQQPQQNGQQQTF